MYSSRLRGSTQWAPAIPQLSDPRGLNLHESDFDDFDITITTSIQPNVSQEHAPARTESPTFASLIYGTEFMPATKRHRSSLSPTTLAAFPRPPSSGPKHVLNVLLLAPSDLAPSAYAFTLARLEQLALRAAKSDDTNSVIVFLLTSSSSSNTATAVTNKLKLATAAPNLHVYGRNASPDRLSDVPTPLLRTYARDKTVQKGISDYAVKQDTHTSPQKGYMQLQAAILAHHDVAVRKSVVMPIMNVEQLAPTLRKQRDALVVKARRKAERERAVVDRKALARKAITELLPATTINDPLSEHHTLLLTDLYPSMQAYARAMSTEQGRIDLVDAFREDGDDGSVAEGIVDFWQHEFVCEI